jgi:hypothetical protein
MKKIIKYTALSLIVLGAFGCEEKEVLFNSSRYVQVGNSAGISVGEDATTPLTSTFILSGPQKTDVTVNFTTSSENDARYVVLPASRSVTIPAGEVTGEITFMPVDNFDTDGNLEVVVTIEESSSLPVGIAGQGLYAISRTFTIIDNDCPITINDWVGTYSVTEVFSVGGGNAGLTLAGAFGESYRLNMVLDPADITGTRLIINNAPSFDPYIPNGTVLSFLTCIGEVRFSPLPLRLASFANMNIQSQLYNEGSFSVSVNGPLGNFGAYEFVLAKI